MYHDAISNMVELQADAVSLPLHWVLFEVLPSMVLVLAVRCPVFREARSGPNFSSPRSGPVFRDPRESLLKIVQKNARLGFCEVQTS